jgi:peroxiredoxin Q/BCP
MAIKKGDKCPVFTLTDQNGEEVNIKDFIGKRNLVIYFYPKDETAGCTAQACSFRDAYEDFKDVGAEVVGISSDSVNSHNAFAKNHNLPFVLLADQQKKVRKLFGVPTNLFGIIPGRVTYIIDKEGVVQGVFNSQMKFKQHVDEAKKILAGLG